MTFEDCGKDLLLSGVILGSYRERCCSWDTAARSMLGCCSDNFLGYGFTILFGLKDLGLAFGFLGFSLLHLPEIRIRLSGMNFGPKSEITNKPKTYHGPHAILLPSTPRPFL